MLVVLAEPVVVLVAVLAVGELLGVDYSIAVQPVVSHGLAVLAVAVIIDFVGLAAVVGVAG